MVLIRRPAAAPGASRAQAAGTTPAKPDPAQRRCRREGSPRVATNPYKACKTSTKAATSPDPLPARKTARK